MVDSIGRGAAVRHPKKYQEYFMRSAARQAAIGFMAGFLRPPVGRTICACPRHDESGSDLWILLDETAARVRLRLTKRPDEKRSVSRHKIVFSLDGAL